MLLLCLGVAAPLLAIGSFSLWKEYQTLKQEANRATTFQAAIAVRAIAHWTQAQLDTVNAIASLSALKSEDLPAVQKILKTGMLAESSWNELVLVDENGKPSIGASRKGAARNEQTLSSDKTTQAFLRQVATAREPRISGYCHSPFTGKPSILAAAPIISNSASGPVRSVLVAAIEPRAVLNLFRGLGDAQGTVIAVVDDNKRVIARTLQHDYWQGKDFSKARTVRAASTKVRGTIEGVGIADPTPRAYAFDHAPDTNWLVVVGVPTREIYGHAHDWLALMSAFAACAIGASVILSLWATLHFTRTIHVLVREALAVGRGDFSKRVHVPARDEFGLLARAFNQMASRLQLNQEMKTMVDGISESIRKSLDLDQILNTTVSELGAALKASRCCLALVDTHFTQDKSDDELVFNYVWIDPSRGGTQLKNSSIMITENSVVKVIIQQGSILSLDIVQEGGPTPLFENSEGSPDDWKSVRSLIACPISTSEEPLGVIMVHQCDRLRVWSDAEIELVEAVARQVTLAMQHARLYNRTKSMAEQELLINHIVRAVRTSLDLDTILNTVTRELLKALGVDRVEIAQPRKEGPLVVTHECQVDTIESIKGVSLYADQMDFSAGPPPLIRSNRAASLIASTTQAFQVRTGDGEKRTSADDAITPSIPEDMRIQAPSGRNTVLGIDLDKLTTAQPIASMVQGDETAEECSERDQDPTTCQEAPLAVISDVDRDSRAIPFSYFLKQAGSRSLIAAPLVNENRLVGLLIVHQCARKREWSPTEVRLVASIADQVAVAIAHAHLFATVKHQAITDGLTGLYNHVYFKNRLAEDLNLARRKGTSCSLLMIDLDKLKHINDNYGHPVGDAAIRQIASILKTLLRSGDTPARYGGEEFGVILPETTLLEAALIADRLCSQIRNSHVPGLGRITASIGAASYPKQGQTPAEIIEKADKALYVAKNSGRDQVRIYEEEETPSSDAQAKANAEETRSI